jgi:hypothetical protein
VASLWKSKAAERAINRLEPKEVADLLYTVEAEAGFPRAKKIP